MGLTMAVAAQRDQVLRVVRPAGSDGDLVVNLDLVSASADLTAVAIAGENLRP